HSASHTQQLPETMGFSSSSRSRAASALLLCLCMLLCRVHGETRKLYIVYLGDVKHGHPDDVVASHDDMLATLLGSKEESSASVAYNYKHGFSGFAAMLTPEQAKQLAEFPEVISVERSKRHRTATTRSWDFLGLNYQMPATGLLHGSNYGEDVIIGVVDSGIWPESRSFNDEGYGPVPSRWKGKCQVGPDWGINNCSRKIIGARFYNPGVSDDLLKVDSLSPRDHVGHGTHCASTAAGSAVEGASFHGLAEGVARGGAPRARIAVYKALWADGSGSTATVLAAIDDAIHDGVDVLSLSLAHPDENSFSALHAVQKGITVVYAGGNDGPRPQTIENTSPWAITVAASKVDRSFPTVITLGNKQHIVPDIAAPGASILAAKEGSYVTMSGTSMAAPHVSGVVALLKALHPDWSPAVIKSAIITSAHVTDEHGMPILTEGLPRKTADPFDYGGGNINPLGAADPGLVYDINPRDYTKFFQCTIMRRTNVSCNATALPAYHLNLPSLAVPDLRRPVTVSRTVTNAGEIDSVYHVIVQSPIGVKMEVVPPVLVFDAVNKERTFKVKLSPGWKIQGDYTFGSITWRSDRKAVRIPVAARITVQDFYADVA
ncbi:hypothetical protein QYE76_049584, partial [Lolium multiflorum]